MSTEERKEYRKTQQMLERTHGGYAGRSITDMLVEQLDAATDRYLSEMVNGTQKGVLIARGEIRGLARAVSTMRNGKHHPAGVKLAESESATRVRKARHADQQQQAQEAPSQAQEAEPGAASPGGGSSA